MVKKNWKQKVYTANESPFSAEQNGKISFFVGYFIYKIRGIKHMREQKPL